MNPKLIIHFQGQFVYCLRLYYLISRHKMTTFDDQYSYYVDFLQLSQKNTIEYFSEQCQCNVQKWKKSNTMSHSIFIQLTWHFVNLFLNSSWESDFEEEQDQNLFRTTHIIVCIMHMQQNRVHLCCLVLANSTLKIQKNFYQSKWKDKLLSDLKWYKIECFMFISRKKKLKMTFLLKWYQL